MVKIDRPVTENLSYCFNEQHSPLDKQADEMRERILNLPDTIMPLGEVRYISQLNGNDENDGLTPETAWKTLARLGERHLDTVLFERGGVYRGGIDLTSRTRYGAYGTGPKPCFYGSDRNYADPDIWEKYSENIWRSKLTEGMRNIGNAYFDYGKIIGNKSIMGIDTLKENFWFWHDMDNDYVYLYCDLGNPGDCFEDIELPNYGNHIHGACVDTHKVLVENFCVKFYAAHGICFRTGAGEVTIRGCEIGFIGGGMQETYADTPVRLGNGVEFVNSYSNCIVEDCWVYQCHDAGISHQNCGFCYNVEDDMIFRNNLVEYCNYNIEMFSRGQKKSMLNNIIYEGNFLRFAGFGWGSINRINSDNFFASNINGWSRYLPHNGNFFIRNNIFDMSFRQHLTYMCPNTEYGPIIIGNTYVTRKGNESCMNYQRIDPEKNDMEYKGLGVSNLEEFIESVKTVDLAPKDIIFVDEVYENELTDKLREGGRVPCLTCDYKYR